MKKPSALDELREKSPLKLTPLEWCIITLDKTNRSFEVAYDAAEELAGLRRKAEESEE